MRGGRIVLGVLLVASACSDSDDDEAPPAADEETTTAAATVSGPVTGGTYGFPYLAMPEDVAEQDGYVEEEYFLSGTATSYEPVGTLGSDGEWDVTKAGAVPYRTRILVRRPADPEDFDGTVVVEWLNVTIGSDLDSEFAYLHDLVAREGWVWVGVSAQRAGIDSGEGLLPEDVPALRQWDPLRYGDLTHPGDAYSYDIFSQAGQALRRPDEVDILEGLKPRVVLATGSSQSAFRMATYVNAVLPLAGIYDGFSIHKRGRGAGALDSAALSMSEPAVVRIRTDLDAPVLQFETESDVTGGLGFYDARQEDSASVVTWEVAGTAHGDTTLLQHYLDTRRRWDPGAVEFSPQVSAECPAVNDGQQAPFFRGALRALRDWVVDGAGPPTGEPLDVVGGTVIARDERGNALGGIRTPAVEAPNRTVTGEPASPTRLCALLGQTVPFDAATLAALYPTHDDYVTAVSDAVDAAVEAGFLDETDGATIVAEAEAAAVPG